MEIKEQVILVDSNDKQTGIEEKISAHLNGGKLHRAFSIFIVNQQGELLLQQRALGKYHSAGLWANTCCSHPRPGEETEQAAHRRLKEELGFDCGLTEIFSFIYKVKLGNNLYEHEYDHVFRGEYNNGITPNPEEVRDYKWLNIAALQADIKKSPDNYAYWLKESINRVALSLSKK